MPDDFFLPGSRSMTQPIAQETQRQNLDDPRRPLRVALLCDFLEERWPSMDLIGDMLARYLGTNCGGKLHAEQLRPPLRYRFSKTPLLGRGRFLWNVDRLVNRFADYPNWLRTRTSGYDVFHLVDHSYSQLIHSLPANRTVVTCHDLDTFRCLLEPEHDNQPRWFRELSRHILGGFQKAAYVITVSAATRRELLRHDLFPPERISVIPNGVHPSCSPQPNPEADEEVRKLLGDLTETRLLLSVGNTLPRKRVDVLLRVFGAVRHEFPKVHLVRVGDLTAEHRQLARELGLLGAIIVLPFLERETLAAIYRRSTLLLHTADAEGFGLPLIEAMACGCPVLASDIPVLREVGGSAASYCPVGDTIAWKDKILRMLAENAEQPSVWNIRRQLALEHAARFSWAENARETAMIYQKVVEQASSQAGA